MAALALFRVAVFIISVNYISGLVPTSGNPEQADQLPAGENPQEAGEELANGNPQGADQQPAGEDPEEAGQQPPAEEGDDPAFDEKCKKQTSYFLKDQQGLEVDLYYDAGGIDPDLGFIKSMCKARQCFQNVSFNFLVGVCLGKNDDGRLECTNADETDTDCTSSYQDICASKLVDDFPAYVCCLYASEGQSATAESCAQDGGIDSDTFTNCVNEQDPNVKPEDMLLENSDAAFNKFQDPNGLPFLAFNGETEQCARQTFYENPEKVICAMLAQGVEQSCDGSGGGGNGEEEGEGAEGEGAEGEGAEGEGAEGEGAEGEGAEGEAVEGEAAEEEAADV